jgi:hypothetical protein
MKNLLNYIYIYIYAFSFVVLHLSSRHVSVQKLHRCSWDDGACGGADENDEDEVLGAGEL